MAELPAGEDDGPKQKEKVNPSLKITKMRSQFGHKITHVLLVKKKGTKMISKFSCKEKELEEWLLASPMFYDKGCKAYRDTLKKKSAVNDKCTEMGIDPGTTTHGTTP